MDWTFGAIITLIAFSWVVCALIGFIAGYFYHANKWGS